MSTILASQDAKAVGEQNRIGKQQQRERDKSLGERHHKSVANRESHAKQIQQVSKGSRRDTGFAISNGWFTGREVTPIRINSLVDYFVRIVFCEYGYICAINYIRKQLKYGEKSGGAWAARTPDHLIKSQACGY